MKLFDPQYVSKRRLKIGDRGPGSATFPNLRHSQSGSPEFASWQASECVLRGRCHRRHVKRHIGIAGRAC